MFRKLVPISLLIPLVVSGVLVYAFLPGAQAASDLVIYEDSITPPWQEVSWGASAKDLTSPEQVLSGSKSIKVTLSAWGALRLRSGPWGQPNNINAGDYSSLSMSVYGGANGGNVVLKLENDSNQTFPTKSFSLAANTWNAILGTMAELNPSSQVIHGFYLQEHNGQTKTYYVDDIKFVGLGLNDGGGSAPPSDTSLPTVSLSQPVSGATVSGTITLTATASDNVGVVGVQFKVDDQNIASEDVTSPYSVNWDSALVADGSHTVSAVARDAAGNISTPQSLTVTVSNIVVTPPNSTPNPPSSAGSGSSAPSNLWVTAYISSWEFNTQSGDGNWGSYTEPEIDWDAFTHLIFFATGLDGSGGCCRVATNSNWNDNRLKKAVAAAHANGKPILFSVGGAGGGGWNSALSNSATRATAVTNLISFMNQYQFDGIDLDPEESTITGAGNSWDDFIDVFAQEIKAKMNLQTAYYDVSKKPILTAAIFNNFNDWARAEPYLDQINIMSYDQTGTWTKETWHNNAAQNIKNPDGTCATLDIAEGNGNTCMATIESDVDDLIAQGVPKSKIGGGIDFNGWVWRGGTKLNDSSSAPLTPRDRWGTTPAQVSVGTASANSDCNFRSTVETRYYNIKKCYLDKYPSSIKWDSYSNVSYFALDNSGTADDVYITFQDAKSVTKAVEFIKNKGIGGMILWEIGGGYLGKNNFSTYSGQRDELLQAVKAATLGVTMPPPPTGDTQAPAVSITAPASGVTVSGTTVTISATASDNVGVIGVQFKLDGVNLGSEDTSSPHSIIWNTTQSLNGFHTLTVVARDAGGNQATATSVIVTVQNGTPPPAGSDTVPPVVALTEPASGAFVSGSVTLVATASDNTAVTKVEFIVDGVVVASDTSTPYSTSWLVSGAGRIRLAARAYDAAGNVGTATSIEVNVSSGLSDGGTAGSGNTGGSSSNGSSGSAGSSTSGGGASGAINFNNLSQSSPVVLNETSKTESQEISGHNQFVNLDSVGISIYSRIVALNSDLEINKRYAIAYFLQNGTTNTLWLGMGERAGVVDSFKSAFARLPQTDLDWQDVIKIANGRWPSRLSPEREQAVYTHYKKIYLKDPDRKNPHDDAAITIMAYGLRNPNRNLNSEKTAIKYFKDIYGRVPASASDWDIMRAIAYSGAVR
ncbi:TPA: hypothetical protein DIC39_00030 [Patescibacteria group bacterium]|nr:hypothetical protein [Patescibacteria group bacterium]HCU47442.1 hypothetical protein [Patescibacteria group bacterium]